MEVLQPSYFRARSIAALSFTLVRCAVPSHIPGRVDDVPVVPEGACAAARDVSVACVIDGDTFDVDECGAERVRLLGIDAPELAHDEPAECWADNARSELHQLISGRDVVLTFDVECRDVYGRILAYAWLLGDADDVLINEWLLAEGHARLFDEDWVDPLRLQQRLVDAEAEARTLGVGLWSACAAE